MSWISDRWPKYSPLHWHITLIFLARPNRTKDDLVLFKLHFRSINCCSRQRKSISFIVSANAPLTSDKFWLVSGCRHMLHLLWKVQINVDKWRPRDNRRTFDLSTTKFVLSCKITTLRWCSGSKWFAVDVRPTPGNLGRWWWYIKAITFPWNE